MAREQVEALHAIHTQEVTGADTCHPGITHSRGPVRSQHSRGSEGPAHALASALLPRVWFRSWPPASILLLDKTSFRPSIWKQWLRPARSRSPAGAGDRKPPPLPPEFPARAEMLMTMKEARGVGGGDGGLASRLLRGRGSQADLFVRRIIVAHVRATWLPLAASEPHPPPWLQGAFVANKLHLLFFRADLKAAGLYLRWTPGLFLNRSAYSPVWAALSH